MIYKFKFTCELCGDVFEASHPGKDRMHHCKACRKYLGSSRMELCNNYIEALRYKRIYETTKKRVYVSQAARREAMNHGDADGCPEDCFFSRYCGAARDCEYILYARKMLPFDGTEFSDECSCYRKATKEEKIQSAREMIESADVECWWKALQRIKL